MADPVRGVRKDEWKEEHHITRHGVLGTLYTRYYTAHWEALVGDPAVATLKTLASFDLEEGDAMPERPVGSLATIEEVTLGVQKGTAAREITVIGFEPKAWES